MFGIFYFVTTMFRQRVAQHDWWADKATKCSEQNKNERKQTNQNDRSIDLNGKFLLFHAWQLLWDLSSWCVVSGKLVSGDNVLKVCTDSHQSTI